MNNKGDYGFLTGLPSNGITREDVVASERKTSVTAQDLLLTNETTSKFVNDKTTSIATNLKHEKTKRSWWSVLFVGSKRGKKKRDHTTNIPRHNSDANLSTRPNLKPEAKLNRNRKCKSVLVDNSVEIFDETNLSNSFSREPFLLPKNNESGVTNPPPQAKSSSRNICLKAESTTSRLTKADDEGENNDHDDGSVTSSSKQQANPLEKDQIKNENSPKDALENEDHVPNNAQGNLNAEGGNAVSSHEVTQCDKRTLPNRSKTLKPVKQSLPAGKIKKGDSKIRRSKSLITFKNPFKKKTKNLPTADKNSEEPKLLNDASNEDFLSELKDKIEANSTTDNRQHSFNVYEKYPRRKAEQRKVLVHIQTKEEIPVRNGIPQWDTRSYQYATQRPLLKRSETFDGKPFRQRTKFVESSFIGGGKPSQSQTLVSMTSEVLPEKSSQTPFSNPSLPPTHLYPDILSSIEGGEKRETLEPQHTVEALIHKPSWENKKKLVKLREPSMASKSENPTANAKKNLETLFDGLEKLQPSTKAKFKGSEQTRETKEETSKTQEWEKPLPICHERASSCDADLLFGRSFILTGMVSSELPDVIVQKHPYLSESSPVRHMAKCLRHAIITGGANQLSPTRTTDDTNPFQLNKEGDNTTIDVKIKDVSPEALKKEISDQCSVNSTPLSQSRRCRSDSDLSSFHVTPMKLNGRYKSREDSGSGKRILRSRSARTDRLLTRMRHRIQRLERLSDLCTNSALPKSTSLCEISSLSNTVAPRSAEQQLKYNSSKKKYSSSHSRDIGIISILKPRGETTLKQFKRLINSQVEKGKYNKETIKRAPIKPPRISSSCHGQSNTEPIYENIWSACEGSDKTSSIAVANTLNEKRPFFSVGHKSHAFGTFGKNTKVTYATVNVRPISSVAASTSQTQEVDAIQAQAPKNAQFQQQGIQEGISLSKHDTFLSSTPVKGYAERALKAVDSAHKLESKSVKLLSNVLSKDDSPQPRTESRSSLQSEKSSLCLENVYPTESETDFQSEREALSPNHSIMPTASDFFLRSLVADSKKEEIRKTMLQEMKKVSTKYSSHDSPPLLHSIQGRKFDDWKEELHFRWKASCYGTDFGTSDSEVTSNGTLKENGDSDSISSGDTLMNEVGDKDVDNSSSSQDHEVASFSAVMHSTPNLPKPKPHYPIGHHGVIEYVIPYADDEASHFMEWDCEETDL